MRIDSLLVSGCSVVGWVVLVVAFLSVVGISVVADDLNVADSLRDNVKLISFAVSLAEADVLDNLSMAERSVAVLALDENIRCVDVSPVDSEGDGNPL